MADASPRLSVDVWNTSVSAVLRTADGTVVALTLDGSAVMSAGVAVTDNGAPQAGARGAAIGAQHPDRYVRMPGRLPDQPVEVASVQVDPVDLIAATFATVAAQARTVTGGALPADVVLCTPAAWGTRRSTRMSVAARRAGLEMPRRLSSAEAIVRHEMGMGTAVPIGAVVAVCRLDATAGELVLLRRRVDGFESLADPEFGELGEMPGATLAEQAAAALGQALEPNAIPANQVSAVFCHVPEDAYPALATALTTGTALAVQPVRVAGQAAALGGLHSTVPAGRIKATWGKAKLAHSIGGALAGWFGAIVLAYQMLTSGDVYDATSINPRTLIIVWCGWGLAATFTILGLVSTALAVSDLRALRAAPSGGPDRKLGSALLFAAALGAGIAAIFGLIGAAQYAYDPAPILRWTLLSAGPLAVVLAVLGLLAGRLPATRPGGSARLTSWADRLRFPVEVTALAAVSSVSVIGSYIGFLFPGREQWWWMEHVGAVGIGFSIAMLLTRHHVRFVIVGLILGGPATYAISLNTVDTIGAFLIAAIVVWWVVQLGRVVVPLLAGQVADLTRTAEDTPASAEVVPGPPAA